MNDWILKLTGETVEAGSEVVGSQLEFHGGMEWIWIALLAAAFAMVIWISYRWLPAELSSGRKATLIILRVAFLVLLLGVLLRPVLTLSLERKIRQTLLVLVDSSRSMAIADPRVTSEDIKRAAIAKGHLDARKGLDQELEEGRAEEFKVLARTNVLQSVLSDETLNLLPELSEKFDLVTFTFGLGGQVRELQRAHREQEKDPSAPSAKLTLKDFPWIDELGAVHSATAMGDSLRETLNRKRGQSLAGIWMISDGAHNTGVQPRTVGSELSNAGVPLYFYGVGITSPRDIIITEMDAPPAAFLEDELLVRVRVRSQGLAGENGQLILTLNGEKVAEETVAFGPDGEQQIPLRFKTNISGEFELKASMAARDDETDSNNNEAARRLRIVDEKIKVLFVEQSPRWDFRYLHAVLTRDRRVQAKTLLLEGDPALAREENTPYLESFPENKKDLFEYDVVVLGDVDPKRLTVTQMENLNEFVSRFGGAFVMIAGRKFSPHAYLDTPVADMLPVEFEKGTDGSGAEIIADKPIRVQLTALGKVDPMLNLVGEDEASITLWDDLPPIYWVAQVDSKPGAEVLMVDPNQETNHGKLPIIARHRYGLGQVLYVGTDNTWRWRRNVGDLYYTRFWGQISQRMAQQRFIGADKRTQISLNSQNYMTGDRIRAYARLYQEGYEPFDDEEVSGVYSSADGSQSEVMLKVVEGQPGLFFGEFIAPAAGQYQFHLEPSPETKRDFTVAEASLEMAETAMNANLMEDLATMTKGRFFREEDLHELAGAIKADRVGVQSRMEVELWATPLYFILILLMVTVEWVVRKFSYLK